MPDNLIEVIIKVHGEGGEEVQRVVDQIKTSIGGMQDTVDKTTAASTKGLFDLEQWRQLSDEVNKFADTLKSVASGLLDIGAEAQVASVKLEAALKGEGFAVGDTMDMMGEAVTGSLKDAQAEMQSLTDAFAAQQISTQRDMQDELASIAASSAARLEDLQAAHADKMIAIQDSIKAYEEDYASSKEDRQQSLTDRLTDMDDSYADRRQSLIDRLAEAETREQQESLSKQLSKLDEQHAKEEQKVKERAARAEARMERDFNRRLERMKKQLADEDEAYAAQTAKIQAEEVKRTAAVEERFKAEAAAAKAAYEEEFSTLQETIDDIVTSTTAPMIKVEKPSQEDVEALAESWAKVTGVSDEAIVTAQSLMLRYSNIGKDVLPQATEAVLNMSAAGIDLSTAAKSVGFALQDPINGLTRLRRAQVVFTEAEKESIKAMAEMGDVAGAQQAILGKILSMSPDLAKEMGQTLPGSLNRLKEAFENAFEPMGEDLAKQVSKLVDSLIWLIDNGIKPLVEGFMQLPEPVRQAIYGIGGLVIVLASVIGKIVMFLGWASIAFGPTGILSGVGAFITGTIIPALGGLAGTLVAVTAPVWLLVGAIVALIAVIAIWGPQAWETVKMLNEIWKALVQQALRVLSGLAVQLADIFAKILQRIIDWAKGSVETVKTWFATVGKGIVDGIWKGIQDAWEGLKTNVKTALDGLLKWIQGSIKSSSPSLVFAEKVGMPMAQGIGMGFNQGMQTNLREMLAVTMNVPSAMGRSSFATGGIRNSVSVGSLSIRGSLSNEERRWFDRRSENIAERAIERFSE